MQEIIGYCYKVYYGSTLLHEDDEVFDEKWQAEEYGNEYVDDKIAEWTLDGGWHDYDSRDDFDVVIVDVVEDMEEW